jgi:hypothetical protein
VFWIENIFHRLRIVREHGKASCTETFMWGLVIDTEILVQVTGDFHGNFLLET